MCNTSSYWNSSSKRSTVYCWVIVIVSGAVTDIVGLEVVEVIQALIEVTVVVLLHVGVLCSQSWYGDLIEEELSLVWTDGWVELIDRLTPVILLTQLLQNLMDGQTDEDWCRDDNTFGSSFWSHFTDLVLLVIIIWHRCTLLNLSVTVALRSCFAWLTPPAASPSCLFVLILASINHIQSHQVPSGHTRTEWLIVTMLKTSWRTRSPKTRRLDGSCLVSLIWSLNSGLCD